MLDDPLPSIDGRSIKAQDVPVGEIDSGNGKLEDYVGIRFVKGVVSQVWSGVGVPAGQHPFWGLTIEQQELKRPL